jgi:hypothetical protein
MTGLRLRLSDGLRGQFTVDATSNARPYINPAICRAQVSPLQLSPRAVTPIYTLDAVNNRASSAGGNMGKLYLNQANGRDLGYGDVILGLCVSAIGVGHGADLGVASGRMNSLLIRKFSCNDFITKETWPEISCGRGRRGSWRVLLPSKLANEVHGWSRNLR